MRNRVLLLIFGVSLFFNFGYAQKCGTYPGYLEEDIQKYPGFYQSLESKNAELKLQNERLLSRMNSAKSADGVKIIPVVVHVIHENGTENISNESIQGALDALNKNINGQSDKFLATYQGFPKTPDVFAARRGVANLEFRLARITPVNPSCDTCTAKATSGILRVHSSYTNGVEPRNLVKSLSYWNAYQYFNIWVVKSISSNNGGITLGYAQFPGASVNQLGFMSTDGVVIMASEMEDPESTTLTHETGHWLGLYHTWGDNICGDDGVYDTPVQHASNGFTEDPGADPSNPNPSKFPWHVGLPSGTVYGCVADSLNPAGEMFMNYMDYTNDAYCTMFTKGQVDIFNETLEGVYDVETGESSVGYREYLWSPSNIELTGVANQDLTPFCAQKPDFTLTIPQGISQSNPLVCEGELLRFRGNRMMFNDATSMTWDFDGGETIQVSGDDNVITHKYNSAGVFDVSLTITYNDIREQRAESLSDLDIVNAISWEADTTYDIVQGTKQELNNLGADNITLHIDDQGYSLESYWKKDKFTVDSLVGAFDIDAFQTHVVEDTIVVYLDGDGNNISTPDSVLFVDDGDSIYIHIDGGNLSSQFLSLLENSEYPMYVDSSLIFTTEFIVDYLDSIVEYNFHYDTAVIEILTYIDSTYLSADDSLLLTNADSSWSIDGMLNSSDSIRIYFAQLNRDTVFKILINTDTASLSPFDSLRFIDADSVWVENKFEGWVDTVRTFYGSHYYTKYNGFFSDTLFYRGELEKVTYIAYYAETCTTSVVKENFITVSSEFASSNESSYSYSFEDESELDEDWVLSGSIDNENQWSFVSVNNTVWKWQSGIAIDGSSSIKIDAEDMSLGSSTEIVSKSYDLSDFESPAIKFSWSGAAANTFPDNELNISYSNDCGATWILLGTVKDEEAANAGLYTIPFEPQLTDWKDTILTNNNLISSSIKFKFEYIVNGNSNNFYLDDIQIDEQESLMIGENISLAKLSIYPNPANTHASIILNNVEEGDNIEVSIVNVLGANVSKLFVGKVASKYQEISADLRRFEKGIYFVKVASKGNVIVAKKLIID